MNVQVGGEKEAVEHFIKEDVIFNQEFAEKHLNLSAIQSSRSQSFISEASFNELQI